MLDPVAKLIELAGPKPRVVARFQRRRRFHGARASAGQATPQARRPAADARGSRTAARERRVEPSLRAHGARPGECRSCRFAAKIERQAGRVSRSRCTRCALRTARERDANRARCWSPPNIATTRLKHCCSSCSAAPACRVLPACPALPRSARAPSRVRCWRCRAPKSKPPRARRAALDRRSLECQTRATRAISCVSD